MNVFLAQMVFVARNDDFEGWTQILVIVIIAVVYGLSNIIIAAKARKLEDKESRTRQAGQSRPVSLKQTPSEHVARQPQVYPVRKIISRGQATEETISNGVEPQLTIQTPQLSARIQEIPEIMHDVEGLPEFISETVNGLEHRATAGSAPTSKRPRAAVPAEIAMAAYPVKPLLDVRDPQAIKKAVQHYESMGKPLLL